MIRTFLYILGSMFSLSVIADAQTTIVIQPGPGNGNDTYSSSAEPDSNFGDSAMLVIRTGGTEENHTNAWLRFELPPIPTTAIVTGAMLEIFADPSDGRPQVYTHTLVISRVMSIWNEDELTWNRSPSVADRIASTAGQDTSYPNYSINVIRYVQQMVTRSLNFGFAISFWRDETGEYYFASSEHPNPELRPKLTLTYVTPNLILQPGPADGEDTYVLSSEPDATFGHAEVLSVGRVPDSGQSVSRISQSYLRFDLSQIPSGAHVDHAMLTLFADSADPRAQLATGTIFFILNVTELWEENMVTARSIPSVSHAYSSGFIQLDEEYPVYTADLTRMIQSIRSDSVTSYGLAIIIDPLPIVPPVAEVFFASSDNPNDTIRPRLSIAYREIAEVMNTKGENKAGEVQGITVQPNPVDVAGTLTFTAVRRVEVAVMLCSIEGRHVRTLMPRAMVKAGEHTIRFDVGDLPPGVYPLWVNAGGVMMEAPPVVVH